MTQITLQSPHEIQPTPFEIAPVVVIGLTIYLWARYGKRIRRWLKEWRRRRRGPRQLKPREPGDCPLCRAHICWLHPRPRRHVVPWSEVKSQAGRPKTIDTTGYACFDPDCKYFLVTDPTVHALVSDGWRGKDGDILYLRCQACGGRKTSRLHTPMYHIETTLARVEMVVTALSEGADISAATRIFGHHHSTISRWLERGGIHSARLHERLFFRVVIVGHIQLDELVTKVKREAERVWVWTAIAARSKLILAVHIGSRAIVDACQLIHQIQRRLAPECLPVFTSDGLNQYYYGLTVHFGYWDKPPRARKHHGFPDERLQYAPLRKVRSGRRVRSRLRVYSTIRLGTREVIRALLQALELTGRIQTSFVERSYLTLRELVAPLSRRTWSLAHDRYHLWLHIQWGLAYYHLARPHQSLQVRVRGPSRCRHRTPAITACRGWLDWPSLVGTQDLAHAVIATNTRLSIPAGGLSLPGQHKTHPGGE